MKQIPVSVVDFNYVKAGFDCAADGGCPGCFEFFDIGDAHFFGSCVVGVVRDRGGSFHV